jgi:uncharacterized protein (TIGR02246 family)
MKIAILAAAIFLSSHMSAYAQSHDEAVIAVVNNQTEAWNRNDAATWAKDYLDDANFINIRGDLTKGRSAIEKLHAFIFSGPYKASHCATTIVSIGYPTPDVAVVETLSEITNFKGLPPGVAATAPGILRTRPKLILVKRDGVWKIFASQNTAISPQQMPVAQ